MGEQAKTTVHLQPKVYRALKVKAATTDRSISELINAAVIEALREDALDLAYTIPRAASFAEKTLALIESTP